MSDNDPNDGLALQEQGGQPLAANGAADFENIQKNAADLEAVFDVPVRVSAILGRAKMPVSELLNLDVGNVLELDRKVGEAVDIYVECPPCCAWRSGACRRKNSGVTMTEIIKSEK